MHSLAFWFQSPDSWPAALLVGAAASLLGLTGLVVVQLRRQVQAAWAETGRIYQRSSARFTAVGDLLDGILFETDATRTLTYTNQAFHALTGFRERDLRSGLTLHDLFEPEERQRLLEDLETAPDTSEVRVRSFYLRRRDGAAVPVSLRLTAITDQDRLVGWRGLFAPLPEMIEEPEVAIEPRAVEQVLGGILREFNDTPPEEHEDVLERGLAEIGRLLGADRCYHYHASGDGERLVSWRQWYAPGVSPMSGDQRLPGLDQYPWTLARLRDDGALVIADVQNLEPGEAPEQGRWLRQGITSLMVVPLREGREIVGVLGCETLGRVRYWGPRDRQLLETMADICRRVQGDNQAARQLAHANERAGDLAELLPDPLAVTDTDGQIVVWNPALAQFSGQAASQACGRPAAAVVESFLPGCGGWLGAQLQAPPVPAASTSVEVTGPAGAPAWIQVSLRPLTDGAGCLLQFRDVTAAKLAESQTRARVDEGLTAASDLATRADDLAQAYRDGVMRRSTFEEFLNVARESSGLINSNLQRASELLTSNQYAAVQPQLIRLADCLGDALRPHAERLREKHIDVVISCPEDLTVMAEPAALHRIAAELATNTLRHAFEGMLVGKITVDVSRRSGQVMLRFADDGGGIDTARQPHLFTAAGAGLHTVYNLVTRNLGGTLRCESKTGKGTVFEIMFPGVGGVEPRSAASANGRAVAAEA